METLQQLNAKHLNDTVTMIQANNSAISIAEFKNDKNALLKLRFTKKGLANQFKYWRNLVDADLKN